ncbi:MAG TPA: DNA repair protein RecN [Gaiellales bacterium]|nr:DNA repair protein RecN [Gaiellales bacterium]
MSLMRLQIENLALIEHAGIEFDGGLNVFTGETGAGKTMLAQAIGLLAGAAPAPGMVGPHGSEAYVEAEFDVPDGFFDEAPEAVRELRPDGETTLVVARRIGASGRSRALLWGRSCARDDLEQLGEMLIEISSQHEARRLARPATQLDLLDAAAGGGDLRRGMAAAWAALRGARARLEAAEAEAAAAERQRGELEELVARVGEAEIEPGERPALEAERERLRHVDELVSAVAGAAAVLNPDEGDGALGMTSRAAELVGGVERFEPALAPVAEELRDAALRLQEASVELRAQLDGFDADPGRLEQVEARLQLFTELERRFGEPAEGLVARAAEARAALDLLDGGGERLAELEREVESALAEATAQAAALHAAREGAAGAFASAVEAELAALGMDGARLEVQLEDAELGARGADRVTLLLAANAGLAAGPIATVASGGELSRIALAVRVVARSGGGPGTLLLDEVDAGVGGRTANAVADTLRRLAADAQLLCITHLPQIAGAADAHFRVEKTGGDPASTAVTRLEGEEVVDEVARMLGAEENDETARRHAATLLS